MARHSGLEELGGHPHWEGREITLDIITPTNIGVASSIDGNPAGLGSGNYAQIEAPEAGPPRFQDTTENRSWKSWPNSTGKINRLPMGLAILAVSTQYTLASSVAVPRSALSTQTISPTSSTGLGWPFGPGWPAFNDWPFAAFGFLTITGALSAMISKRVNNATVSFIGMVVSAFVGFTVLGDQTTAVVVWTMVAVELFFAFSYAVVHRRKRYMGAGYSAVCVPISPSDGLTSPQLALGRPVLNSLVRNDVHLGIER